MFCSKFIKGPSFVCYEIKALMQMQLYITFCFLTCIDRFLGSAIAS